MSLARPFRAVWTYGSNFINKVLQSIPQTQSRICF